LTLRMRPRRYGACAAAVLLMAFAAAFSPARAVDLLAVYRQARANDPELRSARFQNQATAEEKDQALAGLLPQLDFELRQDFTVQKVLSTDNLVFDRGLARYPGTRYTLNLNQPLVRFDLAAGLRRAEARVRSADAALLKAGQDLMLRVAELYFGVLLAQDEEGQFRAEREAVEQQLRLAEAQFANGMAPVTDLRDAQARAASVRARLVEASQRLFDARQALAEVTGELPGDLAGLREGFELARPVPEAPGEWVRVAQESNPGVIALRHDAEAAREEIRRLRAGHYPTVDVVGSYNRDETRGSLFGGGSEIETKQIGLQVRIPISSGGRVSSQVRQAAAQRGKALAELDRALRAVKRQVLASYNGVLLNIRRVAATDETVAAQRLALEAKRAGYDSGLYTLLAVLDAERDLSIALSAYARARYDYVLDSLRLKQAAGTLAEEDLAQVNAWLSAR